MVPPNHLGVAHENVKFTTGDGLELEGWYVPSKNGAAVIAFPGRNGPQAKTRMLARHGYGVLLFDRRGEGDSEGEPNAWGWGGEADIKAAIAYLQDRPDVDPDRIGGIGLSVGGEMMIEAAAETDDLAAVVSEGAGARSTTEDMDQRRLRARQVDARPRDVRGQDRGGRGLLQPGAAGEPEGSRRQGRAADAADRRAERAHRREAQPRLRERGRRLGDAVGDPRVRATSAAWRRGRRSTSGAWSGSSTERCRERRDPSAGLRTSPGAAARRHRCSPRGRSSRHGSRAARPRSWSGSAGPSRCR